MDLQVPRRPIGLASLTLDSRAESPIEDSFAFGGVVSLISFSGELVIPTCLSVGLGRSPCLLSKLGVLRAATLRLEDSEVVFQPRAEQMRGDTEIS